MLRLFLLISPLMIDVFPYSDRWYLAMSGKTPNIIGSPASMIGWAPSSITGIFLAQRSKIYIPMKEKELSVELFFCLRT